MAYCLSLYATVGEDRVIDHVVFVVHGIGPLAELSFRNLVDAGKHIVHVL